MPPRPPPTAIRYGDSAIPAAISPAMPPPAAPPVPIRLAMPPVPAAFAACSPSLPTDSAFLSSFFVLSSTEWVVWSTFCRNRSNAADAFRSVAMISKTSCSKLVAISW